jgi:hypothetical protein
MIIKATLTTLVIILVIVIALSYYNNKEGFDDISNGYYNKFSKDLGNAMNTVVSDLSNSVDSATGNGDKPTSTQGVNDSTPATAQVAPSPIVPIQATAANSSVPTRTDVAPQVDISGSAYNAMTLQQRADLLRDIQKVVRNEILVNRLTTPLLNETRKSKDTDSMAQGDEYSDSCYKDTEYRCPKNPDGTCPPIPDMTKYIKKDAIPCYGCSLDY